MGTRDPTNFLFLLTIIFKALNVMNVFKKVLSLAVVALAITASLNVSAEEKAMKPAAAVEIAITKGNTALTA
jgi:hypothetical protein